MHHRVIQDGRKSSVLPCRFPDCGHIFKCASSQDNIHSYGFAGVITNTDNAWVDHLSELKVIPYWLDQHTGFSRAKIGD